MHASALPPTHDAWPVMEYTGTLMAQAEARVRTNQAGMSVPTLCLYVELDNSAHNTLQVEQPFPIGDFLQVEAAARRLKQGMRVSVQAPLVGMRLVARNAAHIHVIKEPTPPTPPTSPKEATEPCPA